MTGEGEMPADFPSPPTRVILETAEHPPPVVFNPFSSLGVARGTRESSYPDILLGPLARN